MMRTRVVYESMFGNTQAIAQAVAEGLAVSMTVDLEEVGSAATDDTRRRRPARGRWTHTRVWDEPRANPRVGRRAGCGRRRVGRGRDYASGSVR